MTPPDEPSDLRTAGSDGASPAVSHIEVSVLKNRADFLKAARARRQAMPAFLLQARRRGDGEPHDGIRIGFTCSKKVGNAVARNRAKRRLREIARLELPTHGKPGWDYVLIGRRDSTAARPFDALRKDLKDALRQIHAPGNRTSKP